MVRDREVLLLNACEQVLKIIPWPKAVKLLMSGKATKPTNYTKFYEIRTTSGVFELPAAIVLVRFYHLPTAIINPTRDNVFRRDNNTCQYCGLHMKNKKMLTIDHVHPRSKGGDSSWTNLTTACKECNSKKSNKTLKECGMVLKEKPKKPLYYAFHLKGLDENGKKIWEKWIHI